LESCLELSVYSKRNYRREWRILFANYPLNILKEPGRWHSGFQWYPVWKMQGFYLPCSDLLVIISHCSLQYFKIKVSCWHCILLQDLSVLTTGYQIGILCENHGVIHIKQKLNFPIHKGRTENFKNQSQWLFFVRVNTKAQWPYLNKVFVGLSL
jgi:hypothetical protein